MKLLHSANSTTGSSAMNRRLPARVLLRPSTDTYNEQVPTVCCCTHRVLLCSFGEVYMAGVEFDVLRKGVRCWWTSEPLVTQACAEDIRKVAIGHDTDYRFVQSWSNHHPQMQQGVVEYWIKWLQ